MNYAAIPNTSGWENLAIFIGLFGIIAIVVLGTGVFNVITDKFNVKSTAKTITTLVIAMFSACLMAGAWSAGILFINGSIDEVKAGAVETMKSNLTEKYAIDLDGFDVESESHGPARGTGTYTFRNKDASSVVKFDVEFDKRGEPFIVVNEHMTREKVEAMMR